MDFVGGGGSGTGGLGSDNGPILYNEPNRTSAIDDLRSVVIYIFIITIFLGFLLILPGVRNEKVPTFLCITTSIIVTSIILIVLFGTAWHVGQAPISGPYKAFSKDRIQGELSIMIGLRSVNITLRAHKYYELHIAQPVPVIFEDRPPIVGASTSSVEAAVTSSPTSTSKPPVSIGIRRSKAPSFIATQPDNAKQPLPQTTSSRPTLDSAGSVATDGLLPDRSSADEASVDVEIEVDEVFASDSEDSSSPSTSSNTNDKSSDSSQLKKRSVSGGLQVAASENFSDAIAGNSKQRRSTWVSTSGQRYTIERSNVDINYNERFYWIEPDQMRREHHKALERGLPYPILTVVEYLSQDEAGFSWSRQYRMAGYYSYIILWLSFCACMLMFFLHCAAPKYGIYTMQAIGCLLLFTIFTYATLVPKGDRKLVIPFEGQSISLEFGWSYWLVLFGGCLSLIVGTLFVIIDLLYPNFIFTTILDHDFDQHISYYRHNRRRDTKSLGESQNQSDPRPKRPPFLEHSVASSSPSPSEVRQPNSASSVVGDSHSSSMDTAEVLSVGSSSTGGGHTQYSELSDRPVSRRRVSAVKLISTTSSLSSSISKEVATTTAGGAKPNSNKTSHLSELFVGPLIRRSTANTFSGSPTTLSSDSEMRRALNEGQLKRDSSVKVEMLETTSDTHSQLHRMHHGEQQPVRIGGSRHKPQDHYDGGGGTGTSKSVAMKNNNLKTTDHRLRRQATDRHVRL